MPTDFPTSIQTFTDPSGTSPLASGPSHSLLHTTMNDTVEAIQSKIGVGSGTATVNKILVGSGNGTSTWSSTWNSGTLGTATINNATIGTPTITNGTINNVVIGTPTITGGTVANSLIGTSLVSGGTIANSIYGTPTLTIGSDATGDLFYRSSSGTLSRLAIGGTGNILTVSSGTLPSWGSITNISCSLYNSGNLTNVASDGTTTWDSEVWDTGSLHGTANPSRITVPVAGKYLIDSNMVFAAGEDKYFILKRNGTALFQGPRNTGQNLTGSFLVDAAANDYFEISTGINGTATYTIYGGQAYSRFSIIKLSD